MYLFYANFDHLDRLHRVVVTRGHCRNLGNEGVVVNNLSKDRVGRRCALIEPIEKVVVADVLIRGHNVRGCVDKRRREPADKRRTAAIQAHKSTHNKELTSTTLRGSSVGHGKRTGGVAKLVRQFVGDSTFSVARISLAVTALKARVGGGSSRPSTRALGILSVGATKLGEKKGEEAPLDPRYLSFQTLPTHLVHELRNHTVKMNTVIKASVRQVDKVTAGDWHLFRKQLCCAR